MSRLADRSLLLLLIVLAACATRSVHIDVAQPHADLAEAKVKRLISIWQDQVHQYIERHGNGDPAVLSQTRALHSRDVLRPGRITFGALDSESDLPGRNGWDMQGLLIGKQVSGAGSWYVFVVGIVRRNDYRPMEVQDIRMVALRAEGKKLTWETSTPDPLAVQRYRDAFAGSDPIRFPGDTDRFSMTVSGDRVRVQEAQSGADWSLRLSSGAGGRITPPVERKSI